jgi:hypothetical protein
MTSGHCDHCLQTIKRTKDYDVRLYNVYPGVCISTPGHHFSVCRFITVHAASLQPFVKHCAHSPRCSLGVAHAVVEMQYEQRQEGYAGLGSYIDGENSDGE